MFVATSNELVLIVWIESYCKYWIIACISKCYSSFVLPVKKLDAKRFVHSDGDYSTSIAAEGHQMNTTTMRSSQNYMSF